MKQIKLSFLALALLALASCTADKSETYPPADYQEKSYYAVYESVLPFEFSKGDAISVYDGTYSEKFVTSDSGTSATFLGTEDESSTEFSAIYPYTTSLRYKGRVKMNIPASQTAVNNSYDRSASIAVAHTNNSNLAFTNVLAFLKIDLKASYIYNVVSVNVSSNAGEPLAGAVYAQVDNDPQLTAYTAGGVSSQVNLTGDDLYGTYYIAVEPQTLSEGYTIAFTNSEDGRYEVKVAGPVEFKMNEIYDLGVLGDVDWVEGVNDDPTTIKDAVVLKASFKSADFNMVSEGGFEDYPTMPIFYRTAWIPINGADSYAQVYSGTPYEGSVSVLFNASSTGGIWVDFNQFVAVPMNTDMTLSFKQSVNTPYSRNAFIGEGPNENWLNEIQGHDMYDWDYSGYQAWSATDAQYYSVKFNTSNYYWGIVVFTIAGDPNRYEILDDVSLVPDDYELRSIDLDEVSSVGTITNATFDEVSSADKLLAWVNENNELAVAMSKPVIRGAKYDNAIAFADASTLTINKFNKASGKVLPITDTYDSDIISILPESVFSYDGKSYMYYAAVDSETSSDYWTSKYSGFLVSEDGGCTWNIPSHGKRWNVDLSTSPYEWFSQASICHAPDGYFYMVHTKYGRDWSNYSNYFVSRCLDTYDITDPDSWEHWTGLSWSPNDTDVTSASMITIGNESEPCLVYNERFSRFMLIYRSERHEGLVFRDAASVEGPWSGEKIITDDDVNGKCVAPNAVRIAEDGSLYIVASLL